MSRTLKVVLSVVAAVLLVVVVVVVVLVRGSGTDEAAAPSPANRDGATPGPTYAGPTLVGLPSTASWSVAADSRAMFVLAIGSSFVVARVTGPADRGETPMQLSFRDAATGAVRAQLTTPVHLGQRAGNGGLYDIWADSWAGRPALVVRHQIVEPSDRLSAERRTEVVDVYGEDGAKKGSVSRPQSELGFTVVNGWVVSEKAGGTYAQVTVADVDGHVRKTVSCASILCAVAVDIAETPVMQIGSSTIPLVMGDLVFEPQEISGPTSGINPVRVVATDLTTGKQAWSTATMPALRG